MIVRRLKGPYNRHDLCQMPRDKMSSALMTQSQDTYRAKRAQRRGISHESCMCHAKWVIDGRKLCNQHAGRYVLEVLEEKEPDHD